MSWEVLYNPFRRLSPGVTLVLGVVVVLALALLASQGGAHMDGALDIHLGAGATLPVTLMESGLAWLVLALAFWAAGAMLSREGRNPLPYFATTALARVAYIPAVLITSQQVMGRWLNRLVEVWPDGSMLLHPEAAMNPAFLGLSLLALVFIAWYIVLLVFAFKESSKLSGGRAAGGIVGALVVAEAISAIVIRLLAKAMLA